MAFFYSREMSLKGVKRLHRPGAGPESPPLRGECVSKQRRRRHFLPFKLRPTLAAPAACLSPRALCGARARFSAPGGWWTRGRRGPGAESELFVCSAAERLPAGGGDGGGGAHELCPAHAADPGPAAAAAAWGAVLAAARGAQQPAREEPGAAHHQVRVFAAGGAGRRPGSQSGERGRGPGVGSTGTRWGCRMRGPTGG